MNADAGGILVEQAGDDVDLFFDRLERCQALAELDLFAAALGAPVVWVDATSHE